MQKRISNWYIQSLNIHFYWRLFFTPTIVTTELWNFSPPKINFATRSLISSNFCKKRFSGMLSALRFSIFLESSFIEDFLFFSFQQKNEIKKGNTLMEFKYLLFCSSVDWFDVKDSKRNLTDGNLIKKCV